MPFPPTVDRPITYLSLLRDTREVLGTYELLSYSGGEVKFNVEPLKAFEGQTQHFKGDGRIVNTNIICTIRSTGVTEESRGLDLTVLANWLGFTKIIQIGDLSLRIAGAAGIRSWAPMGVGDTKIELEFIPSASAFSDSILRFIDGTVWEFRAAPGSASYYAGDTTGYAGDDTEYAGVAP